MRLVRRGDPAHLRLRMSTLELDVRVLETIANILHLGPCEGLGLKSLIWCPRLCTVM